MKESVEILPMLHEKNFVVQLHLFRSALMLLVALLFQLRPCDRHRPLVASILLSVYHGPFLLSAVCSVLPGDAYDWFVARMRRNGDLRATLIGQSNIELLDTT